jgi:hypothetical protein
MPKYPRRTQDEPVPPAAAPDQTVESLDAELARIDREFAEEAQRQHAAKLIIARRWAPWMKPTFIGGIVAAIMIMFSGGTRERMMFVAAASVIINSVAALALTRGMPATPRGFALTYQSETGRTTKLSVSVLLACCSAGLLAYGALHALDLLA